MKECVIYIHGKGGSASEAEHYVNLFPGYDIYGFDYKAETPWEAKTEFTEYYISLQNKYERIIVVANSIGAYFTLVSLYKKDIYKTFFISPVVNMEKLIEDMIVWAGTDEKTLKEKSVIKTEFGEILDWNYLCWVREHPVEWNNPSRVLYGENDNLQSIDNIKLFCEKTNSDLTVMNDGEHWFHTDKQMAFLDKWISEHMIERRFYEITGIHGTSSRITFDCGDVHILGFGEFGARSGRIDRFLLDSCSLRYENGNFLTESERIELKHLYLEYESRKPRTFIIDWNI